MRTRTAPFVARVVNALRGRYDIRRRARTHKGSGTEFRRRTDSPPKGEGDKR